MSSLQRNKEVERNARPYWASHIAALARRQGRLSRENSESPPLQLVPGTNPSARLVTALADSAVVSCAAPASRLPAPNDKSKRTVGFVTRSSIVQPRSQRKTRHAPIFRSSALTARRRSGNTTPSTTSHSGTMPFSTVPARPPPYPRDSAWQRGGDEAGCSRRADNELSG
jgi:hypothetical protein